MTVSREVAERILGIERPEYAWTIDSYPVTDGFQAEPDGTVLQGPRDASDELLERLAKGEGRKFRLLDDDGILYFEGRILIPGEPDPDAPAGDMHFAPLWDLGEGYGCVDIQYRERTERGGTAWQSL